MIFLRHLGRLLKDFLGFAWQNKAWWIVPFIIILLLFSFLIIFGQTALGVGFLVLGAAAAYVIYWDLNRRGWKTVME